MRMSRGVFGVGMLAGAVALALVAAPVRAQGSKGAEDAAALMAAVPAATPAESLPKWGPFIDLQGAMGTQRNIGETDLFVPLLQDNTSMLFADIRGRFDDRSSQEGNFGLGVRHMLSSGWNLGAYGYYDRLKSALNNDFGQATFGAEALSLDWDARANFYQPVGPSVANLGSTSSSTASLSGTSVEVTTTGTHSQEVAMQGFDGEIGWRVPLFAAGDTTQLRIYAGGYDFHASGVRSIAGPRGRIDLTVHEVPHLWSGSRLEVETEVQHDGPRGTQAFAMLSLRIPLQIFASAAPSSLSPMEQRMEDPIVRDVDVVSETRTEATPTIAETATQTSSGTSFTVINSTSTSGAALPGAVAGLANNSTVLLAGTFNVSATVDLSGNKSLMAGSITVRTPSGHTAVLNTPATISSSNLLRTIQAPGNNTISGLTIVSTDNGGGALAIALNSTGANYDILNNTITMTETGANGISAIASDRNPNLVISGNTFTLTGGTTATAVNLPVVAAPVTTATVSGNTFDVSGATNNFLVNTSNAVINAGSTGNVRIAGTCTGTAASGSVGFTDGTTCH